MPVGYLQEEPVGCPDAHPALVAVPALELERLRRPGRGGGRDDSTAAVDAHELIAEHAEVERRLVNSPQLLDSDRHQLVWNEKSMEESNQSNDSR